MWPQTDVSRVLTNADVALQIFQMTRSPLEQMICEEMRNLDEHKVPGRRRYD